MRAGMGMGIFAVGLGCAGAESVPQPESAPEPAPAAGRKAARTGQSLGELQFEGDSLPVTVQGTTLRVGKYKAQLPSAPFQTLLVQAEIPSVVLQYDTVDDVGPVDVFTVDVGGLVPIYHHDGLSSRLAPVSGGFEARSGQCGETFVTRVMLSMPAPVERQERHGQRDPNCMGAACPFVDVLVAGRWQTQGEILRDQASPIDAGPQTLTLPAEAISRGAVRVRLAERKPERTQLDAVWLEVGGEAFAPARCDELCEVDERVASLEQGDTLELVFDVGEARGVPILWAHGFYVPTR